MTQRSVVFRLALVPFLALAALIVLGQSQTISAEPTATEEFSLRSRCAELVNVVVTRYSKTLLSSPGSGSTLSHYNPHINRCFVEINEATFDSVGGSLLWRSLYDGQTDAMLARVSVTTAHSSNSSETTGSLGRGWPDLARSLAMDLRGDQWRNRNGTWVPASEDNIDFVNALIDAAMADYGDKALNMASSYAGRAPKVDPGFYSAALTAGSILSGFIGTFLTFRIQREASYYRQPILYFADEMKRKPKAKDVHVDLSHFPSSLFLIILGWLCSLYFGVFVPLAALTPLPLFQLMPETILAGVVASLVLVVTYFLNELVHHEMLRRDRDGWPREKWIVWNGIIISVFLGGSAYLSWRHQGNWSKGAMVAAVVLAANLARIVVRAAGPRRVKTAGESVG